MSGQAEEQGSFADGSMLPLQVQRTLQTGSLHITDIAQPTTWQLVAPPTGVHATAK
jgi:hypothetical protein